MTGGTCKKKIKIIIDSNAWNFLYANSIDLGDPLLKSYVFQLPIEVKREMADLENITEKSGLYNYFLDQTKDMELLTYFGSHDPRHPEDEQRFGGFGVGGFASIFNVQIIDENSHYVKNSKRKVYYGNESDLLIASRAVFDTFVLTEDVKKAGPLQKIKNSIKVSRNTKMDATEFKSLLDISTQ